MCPIPLFAEYERSFKYYNRIRREETLCFSLLIIFLTELLEKILLRILRILLPLGPSSSPCLWLLSLSHPIGLPVCQTMTFLLPSSLSLSLPSFLQSNHSPGLAPSTACQPRSVNMRTTQTALFHLHSKLFPFFRPRNSPVCSSIFNVGSAFFTIGS